MWRDGGESMRKWGELIINTVVALVIGVLVIVAAVAIGVMIEIEKRKGING